MSELEVLFSPAEFERLPGRDLRDTTCVVFDILRATSTLVTALRHGASAVLPVATIEQALALREQDPSLLLAGERDGLRITARQTGGTDFDLGNSPREFTPARVAGRSIAMTTTNGTRALRACAGARQTLAGSFLNLSAVETHLRQNRVERLILVCSGTHEQASLEDTLAAGALAGALWDRFQAGLIADSAAMARDLYGMARHALFETVSRAQNARRLLGMPELREDVACCLAVDSAPLVALLNSRGEVVRI